MLLRRLLLLSVHADDIPAKGTPAFLETNKKAKQIFVIGTHAVFSSNARVKGAKEVVVSDTLENEVKGVRIISVTKLLSDELKKR